MDSLIAEAARALAAGDALGALKRVALRGGPSGKVRAVRRPQRTTEASGS